jgi:hypothetical protein
MDREVSKTVILNKYLMVSNLQSLERQLLAVIPYRFRYEVEAILRAFQQSHVMLDIYAQALAVAKLPLIKGKPVCPMAIAFGSFGRLDGATNISDYDVMFLYPGGADRARVSALRSLFRELITSNQALLFDHREAIEKDKFDFDQSHAYPILAVDEIKKQENQIRALQILVEGRCLLSAERFAPMTEDLLAVFGFSNEIHSLNLSPLRAALNQQKSNYCNGVIGGLKARRNALTNRKILKLFALREFSHLANMFALTEIAVAVSSKSCTPSSSVRMLSAPSVLKIASFGSATGPLANLLGGIAPTAKQAATAIVEEYVKKLPRAVVQSFGGFSTEVDEDRFTVNIRILALNVLRCLNALFELLHNPAVLKDIDRLGTDVTTWMTYAYFPKIITWRQELIEASKHLSLALSHILDRVDQTTGCPALEDARISLREITEYKLELGIPNIP